MLCAVGMNARINEEDLPWLSSVYFRFALDHTSSVFALDGLVLATRPAVNTHML
jgi:hypothetical protein